MFDEVENEHDQHRKNENKMYEHTCTIQMEEKMEN